MIFFTHCIQIVHKNKHVGLNSARILGNGFEEERWILMEKKHLVTIYIFVWFISAHAIRPEYDLYMCK